MVIISLIAYAVLGTVAGILSGLLGVSGGIITIPCLLLIFHFIDLPPTHLMQLAIGTSLASMTFNSIASTVSHHMHKRVLWQVVKNMVIGLILGCIIGSYAGHLLPTVILQIIFGIFIILVGIYFYLGKEVHEDEPSLPSSTILNGLGFGIGALSNILGIGGGILVVPTFVAYNVTMRKAIGTSAAIALIITFVGAVCYLIFGLGQTNYKYSVGYIYLPAFSVIAITSFFSAPLGAYLTHVVSTSKLKKCVAVALALIGISMLLRH